MIRITAALGLLLLSACATAPRDACTRDWFEYRSEQLQRDFARRNRGPVRRLNTLRNDLDERPDVYTALALASARSDLRHVASDFRERVLPEARAVAARCELDQGFDILVDAFLLEQGIDADLVRALGLIELFEDDALASTLASGR
ncbi:hypothetical protein [Parvularcula oceani]|uniref:hypothetical protein n=1 Tax=Parvularcula oceani TaxID=1247963 RepID=UPI0004E0E74E|nr:hypothetical protein [Parvularcula oceani]